MRPPTTPPPSAYARLRALLVRGALAPGARVGEDELAALLGVSRTPVREAMRRLRLEGLLVSDGGGARPRVAVAPLDVAEAREVYRAAGVLEGNAARDAATLPADRRAALADALSALDAAFAEAAREPAGAAGGAAAAGDADEAERLFALHHAFHARLADAGAGPVTRALLDALRPRLERYEFAHAPLLRRAGGGFATMHAEHHAIVDAVLGGDPDALERAVRANWENAADRLARAIAQGAAAQGEAAATAAVRG